MSGGLTLDEIRGSTFVVSDLGPVGISRFQAPLVPPLVAILAVGAIDERVVTDPTTSRRDR